MLLKCEVNYVLKRLTMKFKYPSIALVSLIIFLITFRIIGQDKDLLTIESTKEVGQIEVGSPYVGIEIHKSFPLLASIILLQTVLILVKIIGNVKISELCPSD